MRSISSHTALFIVQLATGLVVHRSNLIGMGVLLLQFMGDDTIVSLGIGDTE